MGRTRSTHWRVRSVQLPSGRPLREEAGVAAGRVSSCCSGILVTPVREGGDQGDREQNDHQADHDQVGVRDVNETPVEILRRRVHAGLLFVGVEPYFTPSTATAR